MFHKKKYVTVGLAIAATIGVLISVKLIFFSHPVCKDCNVILISLDTLSANHLPCYGYNRNTAPNLCKFGEDNIMFTNMYANASWTLPSHVSIFTGLYPSQHKIGQSGDYLPPSVPFLPEILQKSGYKTYFYMPIGDWTMPIDTVYYRGIDKITHVNSPMVSWPDGLMKLKENNIKGQKTFLFLHTYWVHDPYILKDPKRTLFAKDVDSFTYPKSRAEANKCTSDFINYVKKAYKKDFEENISGQKIDKKEYVIMSKQLSELSDQKSIAEFCDTNGRFLDFYHYGYNHTLVDTDNTKMMSHLKDLYDSRIFELDEYLKSVFAFVQNSELKKNTIIIVTADHGEEFMEHGTWGHGDNLYDTQVKVPLMVYIPGQENKKVTLPAQSVDIMPTLLTILGIRNPYMLAGSNLFAQNTPKIKYEIAQKFNQNINIDTIRDGEWKLFYEIKDRVPVGVHLFNYKKDPQEKNDVIFTNPAIVERLLKNIPK